MIKIIIAAVSAVSAVCPRPRQARGDWPGPDCLVWVSALFSLLSTRKFFATPGSREADVWTLTSGPGTKWLCVWAGGYWVHIRLYTRQHGLETIEGRRGRFRENIMPARW